MTWKPSEGLRRAESVVQQMLNDLVACGVPPITNPTARWRMVQVVGQALDGFRSNIEAEPEFPVEDAPNGRWEQIEASNEQLTDMIMPLPYAPIVQGTTTKDASVIAPKKRGRGRPKLSAAEKKKRKAAKQANAVEAEAAT